jgi:CheY-like chemotaxis protein
MCHVLVIEDDFLIAIHITALVEEAGATSVAVADTEQGAIDAARDRKPDIIMSDVKLALGTGPLAVQAIILEHGAVPVIFITGSPEDCHPCEPPAIILQKPVNALIVRQAFKRFHEATLLH